MKPEDKKLVAEALLEAAKAVTTSLTDLSEDDWLVVYHGTSLSEVPSLINGFDATRLKYRLYGGPKHRGLFVTPDFKTAERFAPYGEVVLEILVRAKNLHGTDYSGRIGRQQKQEQKTEEWLAGKFPNSFRPYLSLTLTQAVEPQALLIGLVSPKQILRVWHRAKRSDEGRWYTRSEFLALGLEAGPSAEESQPKKVEDLGIDLSSPRLSLDEFLDAAARLAGIPRSRIESSLSMRAGKGEDEIVRLVERLGFQPKAAQAFARKFLKSLTNKQVAKALLGAADALSAASSVHLIFEDGDDTEALFEQAHDLFEKQGIHLHNGYDRFFVLIDDADDERVAATAAMCLYDTDEPPSVEFSVAVAPDQQRKGLAKKLVEEVIRYTKQASTEFDWGDDTEVEAYVVNDKAMVPLLRSLGFEPSSSDPKRWRRKASGSSVTASVEGTVKRIMDKASKANSYEEFLQSTDGEDCLYRGSSDQLSDNVFMTDYVGHAANYAENGMKDVDGIVVDLGTVLYFDDNTFDKMRKEGKYNKSQIKKLYEGHQKLDVTDKSISSVMRALSSDKPYSELIPNIQLNDMLIPVMQEYAKKKGYNIISFLGTDYGDYGGQNEFVVSDISRYPKLSDIWNSAKSSAVSSSSQVARKATGWHGSHRAFELFDISKVRRGEFGPGFYFADDKEEAERYGPAKQYSLDIEAPLEIGNQQHLDVLLAAFPIEQRYKDLISKSSVGFETLFNLLEQKYKMPPETVISHLQALGFDGIRVDNGEQKFWVAFSPEQIKQPVYASSKQEPHLEYYGLKGLLEGKLVKLYHGTTAHFSKFDLTKARDELVNRFYGKGIFLTPSKKVAWKYAFANRNIGFPKTIIDDLKSVNQNAGSFLQFLYENGDGEGEWELYLKDNGLWIASPQPGQGHIDLDRVNEHLGGIDGNTISDIAEHIIGSASARNRKSSEVEEVMNFFNPSTGAPSYVYDLLDEVGLDSSKYRPKVFTVVVKVKNTLVTDSQSEARSAQRDGYDSVVYYGPDTVEDVPEVAVYDASLVKVVDVEVST